MLFVVERFYLPPTSPKWACARLYACVLTRVRDITRAHFVRASRTRKHFTRAFRAHDLAIFGIYIFLHAPKNCAICDFLRNFSTKKRKTKI